MNMEEAIEILNHNYHERVWDHNETARTEEEKRLYGTLYGSNPLKKADLPFI